MTSAAQTRPRGRPRLDDDERQRNLTVRLHPARRAAYEAAASREGLTLTAWLESAADARLERPDYERIARALLANEDVRARLESVVMQTLPDGETTLLARAEWMATQTARRPSMWREIVEWIEGRLADGTTKAPGLPGA